MREIILNTTEGMSPEEVNRRLLFAVEVGGCIVCNTRIYTKAGEGFGVCAKHSTTGQTYLTSQPKLKTLYLSLEDRIVAEFEKEFWSWATKEIPYKHSSRFEPALKAFRAALTTYKSALIGEIEGKVEQCAKDLENAMVDNKSDSSWAWNNALKQSAAKLRHILSDLRT